MFGPLIPGQRIRLEPPRIEDAALYQRWYADKTITRYLLRRHPSTLRHEQSVLEEAADDPGRVLWSIVANTAPEERNVIGATWLERIDWRNGDAKSGVLIGEKGSWGQGHASEAIRLRTDYAFLELGLRRVWSGVEMPNVGSQRALEKVGYRPCGVRRRHVFVDGGWLDVWMGEILREDWDLMRGPQC